jgi:hypothetical protein
MRDRFGPFLWLVMLALALSGCGQRKEVEEYKATWMRLTHTPVKQGAAGKPVRLKAEVETSADIREIGVFIHCATDSSSLAPIRMTMLEPGVYFGNIPPMARGRRVEYYIQAKAGSDLEVRVPKAGDGEFSFYYLGTPNRSILIARVALTILALFIFIVCGYLAVKAIRDRRLRLQIPRLGFLGAVVYFFAAIPLGMIVRYQTMGKAWAGFPLGNDLADNRALAILFYFGTATFLYRGSAFKRDPNLDMVKQVGTLPYVYLVGAGITVVLFLLSAAS